MQKFIKVLVDNMALMVVAVGLTAAFRPELLTWVAPYISLMLGIVMFGMGMTLKFKNFYHVFTHPRQVAIGVIGQFMIMPLAAFILVKLMGLSPELAVGVILVGACPGGTASNVIAYLARGDVALSVALTMTTTMLAPVVTPLLTYYLAGAYIEVSLSQMMLSIAEMVLVPLILGLLLTEFLPQVTSKFKPIMPLLSVVTIVLLVGGVVSLSAGRLFEVGALMFMVVVLHNALGLIFGYGFAYLMGLDARSARTISIESGMQNSGLAASLAVMYFDPVAAIPGAIFSVWHNVSGSLLANYWVRRDEKTKERAAVRV